VFISVLYVDDIIITMNSYQFILWCKKKLSNEFDMKHVGLLHCFLELDVCQVAHEFFPRQGKYTMEILKIFYMLDNKPISTPIVSNMKLTHDNDSYLVDPTM
jgi:hypothetical protein